MPEQVTKDVYVRHLVKWRDLEHCTWLGRAGVIGEPSSMKCLTSPAQL